MIHRNQVEPFLKNAVFVVLAVVGVMQIAVSRGIYGDGANLLAEILSLRDFYVYEYHRLTFLFLTETPLVLAIWSGITNLVFLRYLYSAALLIWPLSFWGLAFYQLRKEFLFWPFVMLFCFSYYNTGFFAVSESNFCAALTACCLACFLRMGPRSRFDRSLMFAAAVLYPLEYAATLFLGPILFILAFLEFRNSADRNIKLYWAVIALLFFASMGTGFWEVLTPRDPGNFANAWNPYAFLHDGQLWLVLFYSLFASVALFARSTSFMASMLFLCLGLLTALLVNLFPWDPSFSYWVRMYMMFSLMPYFLAIIWFQRWGYPYLSRKRKLPPADLMVRYIAPVFIIFVVLSLFDIDLSVKFADYVDHFRSEVNAKTGTVPLEETDLQYTSGEKLFFGLWTHQVMSVVLRDGSDKAIIQNPSWYEGYQGFYPANVIPDLSLFYGKPRPTKK